MISGSPFTVDVPPSAIVVANTRLLNLVTQTEVGVTLDVRLQTADRYGNSRTTDYVNGTAGEMAKELIKFKSEFEELRQGFIDAKVELEGEWGFDIDWKTVGWLTPDTWARIKLDALVQEDETSARVIDYKTGKRWGNEITHGQQGLLYAIGTFFRYPHLQYVQTEFWELDKGETAKKQYTREQAMEFAPGFHRRAIKMTTEKDFTPTPNSSSCRWCSFKTGDDPECSWGVS